MSTHLRVLEGPLRRGLLLELESFRAPDSRVSSYYLNLSPPGGGNGEAARVALKNALAAARERIDQLDMRPAVRHALRRDWEIVAELAVARIGERSTRGLACFLASDAGFGRAVRLPRAVRDRAFFEDRFVLWPLRQVLEQADRYAIVLTDKADARLFLYFVEQIEEIADLMDEIAPHVRFPDPLRQSHYSHKHVEHFHRHFEHAAEAALRLFQREPFEHLIIGGRREIVPQFESHLHRYLRDRVVARWDTDVQTPAAEVLEHARREEQQVLDRQARDIWQTIQDQRQKRGAVGADEAFAALWQRRVQALLVEPDVARSGFRCTACGRLSRKSGPCVECGGRVAETGDVYEEAVHDTVAQSALVRYWKDPALREVDSLAALRRY